MKCSTVVSFDSHVGPVHDKCGRRLCQVHKYVASGGQFSMSDQTLINGFGQ